MKLKWIPLLLCLSMLAACLAGCGSEPPKVEVTESPAPAETAAPTETPADPSAQASEEAPDPEEEARKARYQAAYEKYAPDQTVMLINNEPITWAQYFSWLYDIASQMENNFDVTDWNEPRAELATVVQDGTFGTYVRKTALAYVVQIAVIGQKAKEYGVSLSDEQRADVQAKIDGYAERFGGMDAFEALLAESYLPMEYFREQNEAMVLIDEIFNKLYGENGADLPDEDAIAYLKDNGYLYAKHILFRTVDDSRNPLPEEEAAQKKAEAEKVLAQLRACPAEDLPALFDSLMKQYSEDTGLLSFPDGYYFQPGEMVPAFEETVRTLEESGMSDLVETDYGYHIIYTPPMQPDHIMGYDSNNTPYRMKAFASAALFDSVAEEWYVDAESKVLYVDDFGMLDLNELFGVG